MKLKNKQKIEVFVTIDTKSQIKGIAEKSGISMAEVVKRALELYLK